MKKVIISCLFLNSHLGFAQDAPSDKEKKQEAIIEKYITNGAIKTNYTTQEYQDWIDKGLKEDCTIAYLWRQKEL